MDKNRNRRLVTPVHTRHCLINVSVDVSIGRRVCCNRKKTTNQQQQQTEFATSITRRLYSSSELFFIFLV